MEEYPNTTPYSITEEIWMVPCLLQQRVNTYDPLVKPFQEDINWRKLQSRQAWLSSEDDALSEIVSQRGAKGWVLVAREVNSRVHNGLPVRQGKQCRERYYNHIDPRLVKGKWTESEDMFILHQQQVLGNRWSDISKLLEGRTENQIKNRFKSLWKKALSSCPEGHDPVENYISHRESRHSSENNPFKVISNMMKQTEAASPSTELVDPSPSPSALLFFNHL